MMEIESNTLPHTHSEWVDEGSEILDAEYPWEEFWSDLGLLSKKVAFYYRYLCKCLQPKYRTIGDEEAPVLGSFEKQLYSHPLAQSFVEDEEDLIKFLKEFFTPSIVMRVEYTLDLTRESLLGVDYTRRGLYGSIACTLLFDICEEARLKAAAGIASKAPWEPQSGIAFAFVADNRSFGNQAGIVDTDSKYVLIDGGAEDSSGGGAKDNAGGKGNGGDDEKNGEDTAGDKDNGRDDGTDGEENRDDEKNPVEKVESPKVIFSKIPVLKIEMPAWTSLQKIRERTLNFGAHPSIQQVMSSVPGKFDMTGSRDEDVLLYHGTRAHHLVEFQRVGISPTYTRNELSTEATFYVTDDIHLAYEHPIHKHPGTLGIKSSNLIFGFRLRSRVLCGLLPSDTNESRFIVTTFLNADDSEWDKFCMDNLKAVRNVHEYDIVMSPCCMPRKIQKVDHVDLLRQNSDGWFSQVAFVSRKARQWLQRHLYCILQEIQQD